ncbi:MAG TPA: hypothetical protein VIP11_23255 [Gemmatimonadaceae bacterium]
MPGSSVFALLTGLNTFREKFLWRSKIAWLAFTPRGVKNVDPREPLSRFITTRRWVDWAKKKVNEKAFLPREDGCLSTYRQLGASSATLRRIGDLVASRAREKTLYGTAVIMASDPPLQKLRLKRDWLSLHVDIVGWPQKSEQKAVALKLANASVFVERGSFPR